MAYRYTRAPSIAIIRGTTRGSILGIVSQKLPEPTDSSAPLCSVVPRCAPRVKERWPYFSLIFPRPFPSFAITARIQNIMHSKNLRKNASKRHAEKKEPLVEGTPITYKSNHQKTTPRDKKYDHRARISGYYKRPPIPAKRKDIHETRVHLFNMIIDYCL